MKTIMSTKDKILLITYSNIEDIKPTVQNRMVHKTQIYHLYLENKITAIYIIYNIFISEDGKDHMSIVQNLDIP